MAGSARLTSRSPLAHRFVFEFTSRAIPLFRFTQFFIVTVSAANPQLIVEVSDIAKVAVINLIIAKLAGFTQVDSSGSLHGIALSCCYLDAIVSKTCVARIALLISFLFSGLPASQASFVYLFPVSGCETKYARAHHDYPATDINQVRKKDKCTFVAPIGGVVEDVSRKDRWTYKTNRGEDRGGRSVSFIGDDGVRYYGSHLASIEKGIAPGVRIEAGAVIGIVGSSGSARGTVPHLHFGISYPTAPGDWEIRRGVIWPWKYLDAWRDGKNLSPVKAVARAKESAG